MNQAELWLAFVPVKREEVLADLQTMGEITLRELLPRFERVPTLDGICFTQEIKRLLVIH